MSGKGPDVLNIGNTWSASLQATGAFLPFTPSVMNHIGGSSRFLAGSLSATGAPGKPPAAVPLYSLAYGLYYNKAAVRRGRHQRAAHDLDPVRRRRQEADQRTGTGD